mgnify:CR=1 FL=1|jgi:hypothetical protein
MDISQEEAKLNIQESVEIKIRTYFSIQHIQSAALFCRITHALENQYDGNYNQELFTEYKAYATNAIFSSVCFLEATINEIFCDAIDSPDRISALGEDKIRLLGNMWSLDVPRTASYPIVDKYQIALTLLEKPLFDRGLSPFQDVQILVQLRNALMHYEPEWFLGYSSSNSELESLNKLSKRLKDKFEISKIFKNTGNSFFPDKCMGYGCAKWAVIKSIDFADNFFTKIGMKSTFEYVRHNLKTE